MNQNFNWPPLESDPEIFSKYCKSLGLPSEYQFSELLTLDYEGVQEIPNKVYGVVMAYESGNVPFQHDSTKFRDGSFVNFYMKQTNILDNACGIIACIHTIGNNIDTVTLSPDSILSKFYDTGKNKTPQERATILEGSNDFKTVHSLFAILGQSDLCSNQDEVKTHFVSFVVFNNSLYLLDGCMEAPYLIKEYVTHHTILDETIAEIKSRLEAGNITDNLNIMFLEKLENN